MSECVDMNERAALNGCADMNERAALNERKALPIGVSDFYDLRSSDFCYVDKTSLIQRLLDTKTRAILFTRPRRFGKSLALSMLRRFFDCNDREKARPLFAGLAVAQSERYMAEQGNYPVMLVDLKTAQGDSRQTLETALRNAFRDAIWPFKYLLRSDRLDDLDKNRLEQLYASHATLTDIATSFGFVCSLLARHHGQPVVILVDEYDSPLQSAYLYGFYQPICNILRNFFSSALKGNDNLRLGVITGVLRLAKESLFSGLNNLRVDTILSEDYADCFGFTQAEVATLTRSYAGLDKVGEIREWYDGYRFGQHEIYNPWSVLQYFDNKCRPDAYWLDTSSNDIIKLFLKRLIKSQDNPVKQLYNGVPVLATLDSAVTYEQLASQDSDLLFSLMTVTGYLKPVERVREDSYFLMIPNREIQKIYVREIISHLEEGLKIERLADLGDAIVLGKEKLFAELLNRYMTSSLSYFDTVESFYHGWMLGLLLILRNDYDCYSNREAGEGRSDIRLIPRRGCKGPGVVFELKHSRSYRQLPDKAEEALQQIGVRDYVSAFPAEIKEVLGYGISFCRKKCAIRYRVLRG